MSRIVQPWPRIAFVMSQFPEMHETFIAREMTQLREKGIQYRIFSLKPCKDKIIHPESERLLLHTRYENFFFSREIWESALWFLTHRPWRLISNPGIAVRWLWKEPVGLAKTLLVYPKLLAYARQIQGWGATHIHSHWATVPTTCAYMLWRLTDIPYSFTAHAWDIFLADSMLPEKLRKSTGVLTCTSYNKKYLWESYGRELVEKVHVCYHGLDTASFDLPRRTSLERPLLFSIGRLVPQKGYMDLLEACSRLRDRGLDFECAIVGGGPLKREIEGRIRDLQLQSHVQLLGPTPQAEIKNLLSRSTVFVLPSVVAPNGDRDGIPNVILEAMAAG
ncbi:MAG: glycosyltransferase family 4 protein, partial [Candidatus Omnitrophica bacterium]|nr:glycosyltransferase family 4 protein [Candidatus Omnitrophota bacterium]